MPIAAVGGLTLLPDTLPNDSDKTFIVPAGAEWHVISASILMVTDATVGNRLMTMLITDASDVTVIQYVAGAVQAASLTRTYLFAPAHPNETAFTNLVMLRSLSDQLMIPAGFKIRIFDSAAVAVATDDMTVRLWYRGATV